MQLPKIQFNMKFLLTVTFAVALVGGATKTLGVAFPLLGAFPYSIGFACYIIVLVVGLGTSFSRLKSAPAVYQRSAAGCAVILLSHAPSYIYSVALYSMNAIPQGATSAQSEDWRLTVFGWLAAIEHLLWAAGFVLLLSAIQQRGEEVADSRKATEITEESS